MPALPAVELGFSDWIFPILIAFFVLRNIVKAMRKVKAQVAANTAPGKHRPAQPPKPQRSAAKPARVPAGRPPAERVTLDAPRRSLDAPRRSLDQPTAMELAGNGLFGPSNATDAPERADAFADASWKDSPSAGHFATADDPNFTAHRFAGGQSDAFAFHLADNEARASGRPTAAATPAATASAAQAVRGLLRSPATTRQAVILGEILRRRT